MASKLTSMTSYSRKPQNNSISTVTSSFERGKRLSNIIKMNMKNIMMLSFLLTCAIGFTACNNEPDVTYGTDNQTITVSQQAISASEDGMTVSVDVNATHEFAAYSNVDWITVSPTNSQGKIGTVTVEIAKNTADSARTGNVIIVAGSSRKSIVVTQAAGTVIKAPIDGYEIVWNDEFIGSSLSGDWTVEVQPARWMNNELQEYVNDGDVLHVSNGSLKINLLKNGESYKSARIYGRKSTGFKYGYVEARIKLPTGKGTWPAFWMMPVDYKSWPADGEIDIMEEVGYDPNVVVSTIHCNKYNNTGTSIESARMTVPTAQSEFHVYGMEWTADYITFYVDGEKLLTYKNDGTGKDAWPFDAAFYPILNLAYGGSWGGLQGIDDSNLPATMEIDYIRVFQK